MTISRPVFQNLMIWAMFAFSVTAMAQPSPRSGQTLEGAWNAAIVFQAQGLPPCAPAPTLFTSDGTMTAESCYASEGTGYGAWAHTANNDFAITFIGNSFGPDGTVAATYKVRASVALGPTRNTFTGSFKTEFFDLAGNLVGSVTGTISAVRIAVEP